MLIKFNTLFSLFYRSILFLPILLLWSCFNGEKNKPSKPDNEIADEPVEEDSSIQEAVNIYHTENAQKVIEGFYSPESVATDGTFFYVSNVGRELLPSEKDGDGFISKLDAEGNVIELKWIENLDAPKGMAITKGSLYVADVDKLRGFDLKTRKKVFELDFKKHGTAFLNDISRVDEETLLLSATDIGYVFEVSLYGAGSYEILEIYGDMTGVNGLHFDAKNNRLYMAGFGIEGEPVGVLMEANLNEDTVIQKELHSYQGYLDGIQLLADGRILFSDWKNFEKGGQLMLLDVALQIVEPVMDDVIEGPADFLYDESTNMLWLPAMAENKLLLNRLELN